MSTKVIESCRVGVAEGVKDGDEVEVWGAATVFFGGLSTLFSFETWSRSSSTRCFLTSNPSSNFFLCPPLIPSARTTSTLVFPSPLDTTAAGTVTVLAAIPFPATSKPVVLLRGCGEAVLAAGGEGGLGGEGGRGR